MAKLIERVGKEALVDGKPIDLAILVNMGAEIIDVRNTNWGDRLALIEAKEISLKLAENYGCQYVLLGDRSSYMEYDGGPRKYLFIASFFKVK